MASTSTINRNPLSRNRGSSSNNNNNNNLTKGSSPTTMPTPQPPPSPPATETDADTDSEREDSSSSPSGPPLRGLALVPSEPDQREQEERVTSPVTSPPYWLHTHPQSPYPTRQHARTTSLESLAAGAITLRDNEAASDDDARGSGCWARSVEVTDYVVVNGGGAGGIGAFVVWNVRVETLSGSYMNIRKRYSEFDDFRWRLVRTFPGFEAAVPELPPKSLIAKFRPGFLEKRRLGLQYFLNCILLNPEFSGAPVLKEFLFSRR